MESLLHGNYYHIYNHANSSEDLFLSEANYTFFLEKFKKYISPISKIYSYCLMPNHFHFLVNIKGHNHIQFSSKEVKQKFNSLKTFSAQDEFISVYASKQFSNLFSCYTQAFNKVNSRRGSLFLKSFKRKHITDENYFVRLVNYIHNNPVTHGFVMKPEDWKFSSYNAILSDKPTLIEREDVLDWFDGMEDFIFCHRCPMDL